MTKSVWNKVILSVLIVFMACFVLVGCSLFKTETPEYKITVNVSDAQAGRVVFGPMETTFAGRDQNFLGPVEYVYKDDVVKLEAIANDGYVFDRWSDGNKSRYISIDVIEDVTITAYFVKGKQVTYNDYVITAVNSKITEISNGFLIEPDESVYVSGVNFGYWKNGASAYSYARSFILAKSDINTDFRFEPINSAYGVALVALPSNANTYIMTNGVYTANEFTQKVLKKDNITNEYEYYCAMSTFKNNVKQEVVTKCDSKTSTQSGDEDKFVVDFGKVSASEYSYILFGIAMFFIDENGKKVVHYQNRTAITNQSGFGREDTMAVMVGSKVLRVTAKVFGK